MYRNFIIGTAQSLIDTEIPALWTPSQLNTVLWLDAKDSNTITESIGFISQWDDKSGNSNHAIQSIGAEQPQVSSINSKESVLFQQKSLIISDDASFNSIGGLSTFFAFTGLGTGTSTDFRCAIITKGTTQSYSVSYKYNTGGDLNIQYIANSSFAPIRVDGAVYDFLDGKQHIITFLNNDSIQHELYKDGNPSHRANYPASGQVDNSNPVVIGNRFLPYNKQDMHAHVHEVILLNYTATQDQAEKIEGYLAHKWGTVGELPVSHPYKNSAPTI